MKAAQQLLLTLIVLLFFGPTARADFLMPLSQQAVLAQALFGDLTVPEPPSIVLAAIGLCCLAVGYRWCKRATGSSQHGTHSDDVVSKRGAQFRS
jgi:hypothetical protein